MTFKDAALPLAALLTGGALFSSLLLSGCEYETKFVDFVPEICNDKVDNDEDTRIDCDDTDCDAQCRVEVVVLPPGNTTADTLRVSGTHLNAASVTIQVTPDGAGGNARLDSSGAWDFLITSISSTTLHTITATATSAKGLKDTAITTFEKRL